MGQHFVNIRKVGKGLDQNDKIDYNIELSEDHPSCKRNIKPIRDKENIRESYFEAGQDTVVQTPVM